MYLEPMRDPRDWIQCKHERTKDSCLLCFKEDMIIQIEVSEMRYFKSVMDFMGDLIIGQPQSINDDRLIHWGAPYRTDDDDEWEIFV